MYCTTCGHCYEVNRECDTVHQPETMQCATAGSVVQEEVSTIMRYLGAYPTEMAMVKDILPDMQVRITLEKEKEEDGMFRVVTYIHCTCAKFQIIYQVRTRG